MPLFTLISAQQEMVQQEEKHMNLKGPDKKLV